MGLALESPIAARQYGFEILIISKVYSLQALIQVCSNAAQTPVIAL